MEISKKRRPKFDATKDVTKNFHVNESQQIHKYDIIPIKNHTKNTCFSYQSKWSWVQSMNVPNNISLEINFQRTIKMTQLIQLL